MFTPDTLSGKQILITGGGSGLGLSMAKAFVAHGASVAICGRTESKLEVAAAEILAVAQPGSRVLWRGCDVRDYAQVEALAAYLASEWGVTNGLVNNAAGNFLSTAEDLSPGGFKAVVDIVLHGSFNCSHAFGRRMIDAGQPGAILNIVTTYTETGCAFVLPSAAAKAGVLAMANTLAFEWAGYGIRVNSIAPGPFPTEGAWSRLLPDESAKDLMLRRHPMKRPGEHPELMHVATFLMSDMASYMTGACVPVDGGERLQGAEFAFIAELMPRDQLRAVFQQMKAKTQK
jgi:NAD(P)-dependent dehydrogenase (short-subunit alcohol dehydrogenase family)